MTVFEVVCEVGGYYPDDIDWPTCGDPNPSMCTDYPPAPPGVPISIVKKVPQAPGGYVVYKCNDTSKISTLGDEIRVRSKFLNGLNNLRLHKVYKVAFTYVFSMAVKMHNLLSF